MRPGARFYAGCWCLWLAATLSEAGAQEGASVIDLRLFATTNEAPRETSRTHQQETHTPQEPQTTSSTHNQRPPKLMAAVDHLEEYQYSALATGAAAAVPGSESNNVGAPEPVQSSARFRRAPSGSTGTPTIVRALAGQQALIPCGQPGSGSVLQAAPPPLDTGEPGLVVVVPGSRRKHATSRQRGQQAPAANAVSVLVWYRDGRMDAPVFVADARNVSQVRDAKQVLGAEWLRGRARLWHRSGWAPGLLLEPARLTDAGLYTCTMEHLEAPTETHQVRLELVDPPRGLQIREPDGRPVSNHLTGPYDEQTAPGALACQLEFAGAPQRARLSWWRQEASWPLPGEPPATVAAAAAAADSLLSVAQVSEPELQYLVAGGSLEEAGAAWLPEGPLVASRWRRVTEPGGPNQEQQEEEAAAAGERVHLELGKLARQHLNQRFLCTASNNNFSAPLNSSVKLDLNLAPAEVRIMNRQQASFRSGQRAIVECRVYGSRPAPRIQWLRGGQPIDSSATQSGAPTPEETLPPPDETGAPRISEFSDTKEAARISYLSFVPRQEDHQRPLTCTAYNPRLATPAGPLSDSLVMNVHFPARLRLELGAGLSNQSLLLGQDVFMECTVEANPTLDGAELGWLHEGRPLADNQSAGVHVINSTLVLQKLQVNQRGAYQCQGRTALGLFQSNKLHLRPRFEPVCDYALTKSRLEVHVNQSARVECHVLAEPGDNLHFEWQFNQTLPSTDELTESAATHYQLDDIKQFETNSSRSQVIFRPASRRHQGQLLCWASNQMGRQQRPCVIQVLTSELPAPVFGCFFDALTSHSFSVHCQQSQRAESTYSPNRPAPHQNYLLELHSSEDNGAEPPVDGNAAAAALDNEHPAAGADGQPRGTRIARLTSDSASFALNNLQPATNYNVIIYAVDARGARSPPSFNQVTTLPASSAASTTPENSLEGADSVLVLDSQRAQLPSLPERLLAYLGAGGAAGDQLQQSHMGGRFRPLVALVAGVLVVCALAILLLVYLVSKWSRCSVGASRGRANQVYDKRQPAQATTKSVPLALSASCRMRALAAGNGSDSSRETNTDSTTLSVHLAPSQNAAQVAPAAGVELSLDRRRGSLQSRLNEHRRPSGTAVPADRATLWRPQQPTTADCSQHQQQQQDAALPAADRCSVASSYSSSVPRPRCNQAPPEAGRLQSASTLQRAALVSPQSDLGTNYQSGAHDERFLLQCRQVPEPIYVISPGCAGEPANLQLLDPDHLWALQQQQQHHHLHLTGAADSSSYDTTPSSSHYGQQQQQQLPQHFADLAPPLRYLSSSASIPVSLSACQHRQCHLPGAAHQEQVQHQQCSSAQPHDSSSSYLALSPATGMLEEPGQATDNSQLMYYRALLETEQN